MFLKIGWLPFNTTSTLLQLQGFFFFVNFCILILFFFKKTLQFVFNIQSINPNLSPHQHQHLNPRHQHQNRWLAKESHLTSLSHRQVSKDHQTKRAMLSSTPTIEVDSESEGFGAVEETISMIASDSVVDSSINVDETESMGEEIEPMDEDVLNFQSMMQDQLDGENFMEEGEFDALKAEEARLNQELEDFHNMASIKHISNLIQWWIGHKEQFPLLYHVALDILIAAGTEANVERMFSVLTLILTKYRTQLTPEMIKILTTLHLNGIKTDFVFKIQGAPEF